jgi:hypothetical protein
LDPITAENGTTVDYQVCFTVGGDSRLCKKDSFLIWGNADQTLAELPEKDQPVDPAEQLPVTLDTWELSPQISSAEHQEIGACIHVDGQPEPNMNAQLILEAPNSDVKKYRTAATDQGGCSFFKLDPVDAKNGEAVPYQVCFINKYGEKFCKRDSFLIWGNP